MGLFSKPIPYEVRIPNGDASPFFGNYVGQKYGPYDTHTCWGFALIEICETQLELERALGRFSKEALDWFQKNGYIDEDGDFYLSRRWLGIMGGQVDNGWDEALGWELIKKIGLIPFTMLPYDIADIADENTREEFRAEYFDPAVITSEMTALGKEFLKYVNIESEELGQRWTYRNSTEIETALKQGPLQIGVSVPGWAWNQEKVTWDGNKIPAHSVELYRYERGSDFPYYIYDSYEPHLKRLSASYYIPIITRCVVTARQLKLDGNTPIPYSVIQRFIQILKDIGIFIVKGIME